MYTQVVHIHQAIDITTRSMHLMQLQCEWGAREKEEHSYSFMLFRRCSRTKNSSLKFCAESVSHWIRSSYTKYISDIWYDAVIFRLTRKNLALNLYRFFRIHFKIGWRILIILLYISIACWRLLWIKSKKCSRNHLTTRFFCCRGTRLPWVPTYKETNCLE